MGRKKKLLNNTNIPSMRLRDLPAVCSMIFGQHTRMKKSKRSLPSGKRTRRRRKPS